MPRNLAYNHVLHGHLSRPPVHSFAARLTMSSAVISDVNRRANGESKYPLSSDDEPHASSIDDISSLENDHTSNTNHLNRGHLRLPSLSSRPTSSFRLSSGSPSMFDGVKRKFARLYTQSPSCTSLGPQSTAGNLANQAGNKSAMSTSPSKGVANSYNVAVEKLRKSEYPDLAGMLFFLPHFSSPRADKEQDVLILTMRGPNCQQSLYLLPSRKT